MCSREAGALHQWAGGAGTTLPPSPGLGGDLFQGEMSHLPTRLEAHRYIHSKGSNVEARGAFEATSEALAQGSPAASAMGRKGQGRTTAHNGPTATPGQPSSPCWVGGKGCAAL